MSKSIRENLAVLGRILRTTGTFKSALVFQIEAFVFLAIIVGVPGLSPSIVRPVAGMILGFLVLSWWLMAVGFSDLLAEVRET